MLTRNQAGTLKYGRKGHGVIFDGEKFLIIGGSPSINNEVCTLTGSTMTCVELLATSDNYNWHPDLFLVAADFGKDANKC